MQRPVTGPVSFAPVPLRTTLTPIRTSATGRVLPTAPIAEVAITREDFLPNEVTECPVGFVNENAYTRFTRSLDDHLVPLLMIPDTNLPSYENTWGLALFNQQSIQRAYQTARLLSRTPKIVPEACGMVTWSGVPSIIQRTGAAYKSITVHDVRSVHHLPYEHFDHLSLAVLMALKSKTAKNLFKIASNVCYNGANKTLTVKANSFPEAIATLAIIKMYDQGHVDLLEARDLHRYYITGARAEWNDFERMALENQVIYSQTFPVASRLEEYLFDQGI
jgi:hypothetical protein